MKVLRMNIESAEIHLLDYALILTSRIFSICRHPYIPTFLHFYKHPSNPEIETRGVTTEIWRSFTATSPLTTLSPKIMSNRKSFMQLYTCTEDGFEVWERVESGLFCITLGTATSTQNWPWIATVVPYKMAGRCERSWLVSLVFFWLMD